MRRIHFFIPAVTSLTAILLLLTSCASRQTKTPIPPMNEVLAMVELIDQEVDLTAEQRQLVRGVVSQTSEVTTRAIDQYRGRPIELHESLKMQMRKFDRQMRGILTEEQVGSWKPLYDDIYEKVMNPYDRGERDEYRQRPQDPVMGY